MKKFLMSMLVLLIVVSATCFAVACKQPSQVSEPAHRHSFTNYVFNNDAKCGVDGTKTATCSCGETNTKTASGTALSHSFTNYVFNNDAKCDVDGTKTATCDNGCGTKKTVVAYGTAVHHAFINYVYDEEITCGRNRTKTAVCEKGCGATETVRVMGTMVEHSFTKYVLDGEKLVATCDNGCGETKEAPVVKENSTTVGKDLAIKDKTVPADVETFEDAMAWVNTLDDNGNKKKNVKIKCEIGGVEKNGILLDSDVKLTEDVIIDVWANASTLNINIIGDVTIDLNGYNIIQKTYQGLSVSLFTVRDGATLNIIDTSIEQDGGIYVGFSAFQIDEGATLNLYSGTVGVSSERSTADVENGCQPVFVYGGTFNMYGGAIETVEHQYESWSSCMGNSYGTGGDVYLYGGKLNGYIDATVFDVFVNNGAKINGTVIK
ncbi:MAG: hypothetical protein E7342_00545 [Clostridiales bacterium]|nr:hypothetical protein [Clostridiales bacterium]